MKPPSSTQQQKSIAALLNINVDNETFEVAAAKIKDLVATSINELPPIDPSQPQRDLAKKLKISVKNGTMRVAFAKIADAIFEKNTNAVEKMSLKKGDVVRYRGDPKSQPMTISTIKLNGRIYFKGTNCPTAWASELIKVKKKMR